MRAIARWRAYSYSPELDEFMAQNPISTGSGSISGRAVLESKPIHIVDVQEDPEYTFKNAVRIRGFRAMLGVPLMREGKPIGVMVLSRRTVQPLKAKSRALTI
jgi:two-component system, NtrC family, sensor kinase